MVKIEEDESVEVFPISLLPKKAAIVIDKNTASSAETLIRYAKMCCDTTRTKVYGKENTWGAQYSGNIERHYPIARSACIILRAFRHYFFRVNAMAVQDFRPMFISICRTHKS